MLGDMRLHGGSTVSACALALLTGLFIRPVAAAHFDCSGPDDVRGEVQDSSGYLCASRCAADTFNCPTDVPVGTSAQPQCMLQDVDRGSFCGLLCQVDSQCPNGARCRQMKQVEVGLCLFPVSFTDWAKQGTNRKFNVGWPTRAGGVTAGAGTSSSFQIAKTFAALQSLKSKYSIDDGDADMLILKELLSSMTASSSASSAVPGGAPGPLGALGGGGSAPPRPQSGGGSVVGAWHHDITQFEGYVGDGVPGLQREAHDIAWNVEHIYHSNAASALLRGVILFGLAYVSVGSFFKYQTGARGIEMIPHVSFWMEYPAMVADGVTYSKVLLGMQSGGSSDFLSGGLHSGGGAGAFETL